MKFIEVLSHDHEDLDASNWVYCVKSVSPICLEESEARMNVNSIAVRFREANALPALTSLDSFRSQTPASSNVAGHGTGDGKDTGQSEPRVKFSDKEDVRLLSPASDASKELFRPSSPTSSGASSPVSDSDASVPLAKALANRLSFWSKLSKKQATQGAEGDQEGGSTNSSQDRVENAEEEPEVVLQDILDMAASQPATVEERHNELDKKILKALIREFAKGGMYFAYNFGEFSSVGGEV